MLLYLPLIAVLSVYLGWRANTEWRLHQQWQREAEERRRHQRGAEHFFAVLDRKAQRYEAAREQDRVANQRTQGRLEGTDVHAD